MRQAILPRDINLISWKKVTFEREGQKFGAHVSRKGTWGGKVGDGFIWIQRLSSALAKGTVISGITNFGETRASLPIGNKKGIPSLICGVEYNIFDKSVNHDVQQEKTVHEFVWRRFGGKVFTFSHPFLGKVFAFTHLF